LPNHSIYESIKQKKKDFGLGLLSFEVEGGVSVGSLNNGNKIDAILVV